MKNFSAYLMDSAFVCSAVSPEKMTVLLKADAGYLAISDDGTERNFDSIVSYLEHISPWEDEFLRCKSRDMKSFAEIDSIACQTDHPNREIATQRLREILGGLDANIAEVATSLSRSIEGRFRFFSSVHEDVEDALEERPDDVVIWKVWDQSKPEDVENSHKDPRLETAWGRIELLRALKHPLSGQIIDTLLVPPGTADEDITMNHPRRLIAQMSRIGLLEKMGAAESMVDQIHVDLQSELDEWFNTVLATRAASDGFQFSTVMLSNSEANHQFDGVSLVMRPGGYFVQTPSRMFDVTFDGEVQEYAPHGLKATFGTHEYMVFESSPVFSSGELSGVSVLDLESGEWLQRWPESRPKILARFCANTKSGNMFILAVDERIASAQPFIGSMIARTEYNFWLQSETEFGLIVGNAFGKIPDTVRFVLNIEDETVVEKPTPRGEIFLVWSLDEIVAVVLPDNAIAYAYEDVKNLYVLTSNELISVGLTNIHDFLEPTIWRSPLPDTVVECLCDT